MLFTRADVAQRIQDLDAIALQSLILTLLDVAIDTGDPALKRAREHFLIGFAYGRAEKELADQHARKP